MCGARFEVGGEGDGKDEDGWFRVYLQQGQGCCEGAGGLGDDGENVPGKEVGEEVMRLAGGEMPDPNAGVGP